MDGWMNGRMEGRENKKEMKGMVQWPAGIRITIVTQTICGSHNTHGCKMTSEVFDHVLIKSIHEA